MSGTSSSASSSGAGGTTLLTIAFIVLKLAGVIAWSWWWVLSLIWISAGLVLIVLVVALSVMAIHAVVTRWSRGGHAVSASRPVKHGTYAGYNWHNNHKVPMCVACREAQRQYITKWRADPEKRVRQNAMTKAGDLARRKLAARHSDEYRKLYREELSALVVGAREDADPSESVRGDVGHDEHLPQQ